MLPAQPELLYPTFLGVPPGECAYADSRVVLVQCPYDGTTSYGGGARNGPQAILNASQQVEFYDVELRREPCAVGVHALPSLLPSAAGPEAVIEEVEALCARVLGDGKVPFLLGGEHSVTLGNARACAAVHGPLTFLQIDAHLDLRDAYQQSPFSHACIARRLLDLGPVVAVGVRVACAEEIALIENRDLRPFWAHELQQQPRADWVARVVERLGAGTGGGAGDKVYVTVDVDGLDPSVIPATGTPIPGGLGWYDVLALLRAVGEQRTVVGCDLVELAPPPGDHQSSFAAALLVQKMIGYFFTV